MHTVGEIMRPPLEHRLLTDRVLQDLNRPDAFDMDLGFHDGTGWFSIGENDLMAFGYNGRRWSGVWASGLADRLKTNQWQQSD